MNSQLADTSVHVPFTSAGYLLLPPRADDIAVRAYRLYEERGAVDGHDVEDWVEAEDQLNVEQFETDRPASYERR
jgi:hypothetical protein